MDVYLSQLRGPEVTIQVGKGNEARDFVVAKDLLCAKNKWFESALKGDRFLESQTGLVKLPDDTPAAFEAFYYHLLTDQLQFPRVAYKEESQDRFGEQLKLLLEIWIFGDKYDDQKLQGTAFGRVCRLLSYATWTELTIESKYLVASFSQTSQSSPLRAIVADYVVSRLSNRPQSAGQVLHGLSAYHDFAISLQQSQDLLYSASSGDFPRYLKPKKHFAKAAREAAKASKEPAGMITTGRNWQISKFICCECGSTDKNEGDMVLGCGCHGTDAKQHGCSVKPLCKNCEELAHTRGFKNIAMPFY